MIKEGGPVDESCRWKRIGERTTCCREEGTCNKVEAEELRGERKYKLGQMISGGICSPDEVDYIQQKHNCHLSERKSNL